MFEQVAHAACANANKHFDEIRAGNRKERNIGFACNRLRQESFSTTRLPRQQNSAWNASAKFAEALWVLQKFNNFLNFFLRFLNASDIVEGDIDIFFVRDSVATFAERSEHSAWTAAASIAHAACDQEPKHSQNQETRSECQQQLHKHALPDLFLPLDSRSCQLLANPIVIAWNNANPNLSAFLSSAISCSRQSLGQSRHQFVIFNYDRCGFEITSLCQDEKLLWSFDRLASLRSACQHGPYHCDHGKCQNPCHELAARLWGSRYAFLLAIWPRCFSFGITVGRWTIIRRCHLNRRAELLRSLR